jgi:hypothetical protein
MSAPSLPNPNEPIAGTFGPRESWFRWLFHVQRVVSGQAVIILRRVTVAQLAGVETTAGSMLIVTDAVGGEVPAWCDSSGDWRRTTDGTVVS